MKFQFNAVRFDGTTKAIEIEATSEAKAIKQFNQLFGKFWVGTIIK